MTENTKPNWIKLGKHLINTNNIAGFSVDWNHDSTCHEVIIHFPALSYTIYLGTEQECIDTLGHIQSMIGGVVWQMSTGKEKGIE